MTCSLYAFIAASYSATSDCGGLTAMTGSSALIWFEEIGVMIGNWLGRGGVYIRWI